MRSLNATQGAKQLDVQPHLRRARPAPFVQGSAVVLQGLESGASYGKQGLEGGAPFTLAFDVLRSSSMHLEQQEPQRRTAACGGASGRLTR